MYTHNQDFFPFVFIAAAVSNMLFYFDRTMKYSSQHRQTNERGRKKNVKKSTWVTDRKNKNLFFLLLIFKVCGCSVCMDIYMKQYGQFEMALMCNFSSSLFVVVTRIKYFLEKKIPTVVCLCTQHKLNFYHENFTIAQKSF